MTARDVQVEVTVAGVDVAAVALERLVVTWGRDGLDAQPDTATLRLIIDVTKAGWDTDALPVGLGATAVVNAVHAGTTAEVFRGEVDEAVLRWDEQTEAAHLVVTADDSLADLAQIKIGDEPWDAETAEARADRIVDLLTPQDHAVPVTYPVRVSWESAGLGQLPERLWSVAPRDVDRQPVLTLLHELATSTDTGVYVVAGPITGGDPEADPPLPGAPARMVLFHGLSLDHPGREFVESPPGTWTVQPATGGAEVTLSADHLRASPDYRRGRDQLVTDVRIGYKTTDGTGDLEHAVTRTAVVPNEQRRATVLTQLAEVQDLADRLLRRGVPIWHTETLAWDANDGQPAAAEAAMLALLASATRVGLSVLLADLPAWVPAEAAFVFTEGGRIEYVADEHDQADAHPGRWVLTLAVVPAAGVGRGITYAETLANYPAITYNNLDPTIRTADVLAVGVTT